jgi:hypothetical protein
MEREEVSMGLKSETPKLMGNGADATAIYAGATPRAD